ncbi:serine/threonine-protein kinase [Sphingomonas sp. Xoc002]|uniref:serine/threonine-protein kinase n=1 Tax=Sphingomonas sp. Xoc002 TaxID=2837624 RepID=UPI003D163B27
MSKVQKLQGRYVIIEKIGDGGMQSVFKAHDTLVDREVALKTPLPGQVAKKFVNSAVIAARVNNPYVAKTYDYFEHDDKPYLIEELVDGCNLEDIFPEGTFVDPNTGAHIMLALAKGIAASHKAGVVHRDLKPSNIVCERGSLLNKVKITDFGIATLADEIFAQEALSGDLTKSTSGTVKGAMPYMSPEMLFRQPGDHPGKPSDIWSLGSMMFKILTGIYPFGVNMMVPVNISNGTRADWPDGMVAKVQFAALVRELQAIIDRCTAKDPTHRPTADDIVKECENLCFCSSNRHGKISSVSGNTGRIRTASGTTAFFHIDSFYGDTPPLVGDRVLFATFPGTPYPRAHPIGRLPANA